MTVESFWTRTFELGNISFTPLSLLLGIFLLLLAMLVQRLVYRHLTHRFISGSVINWSHSDNRVRCHIPGRLQERNQLSYLEAPNTP